MRKYLLLSLLVSSLPVFAQQNDTSRQGSSTGAAQSNSQTFDFSIRNIMRGPELYGRPPENVRWTTDSKWIYFTWLEAGRPWNEPLTSFRVSATPGATPERVSPAHMDSAGPLLARGSPSPDGGYSAVEHNGDLFIVEKQTTSVRRLTKTQSRESRPIFSTDGRLVYFVRDNNIYSIDAQTGLVTQLTDIRLKDSAINKKESADSQKSRLAKQQTDLLQAIRDKLYSDSIAEQSARERKTLDLKPVYLGDQKEIATIDISPNGYAALIVVRISEKSTETEVPHFVTKSGYTETRSGRAKVGDAATRYSLYHLQISSGVATRIKPFDTDSLSEYIVSAAWNSTGTHAAFYAFHPDNKSRLLYSLSQTGELTLLERLTDTAWVGGPCVSCLGWMKDGSQVWYVSEATGFSHLYTVGTSGRGRRQLTSGSWEVRNVTPGPADENFYLIANKISPFEEQLYRLPFSGGELTQITSRSGRHYAVVSPDGRMLADVYSYVNTPPDLYLKANEINAQPSRLTVSPSKEWSSHSWVVPELVTISASDGAQVPAHLYHPNDVGAKPNGAAVIFVHGAGYLHNVGNFWSEYPREYMFNQFLAREGYIVLDIDYRASDGYGRDWRTAIYRWMGGRDLQDHVDGSRYLTSTYGIPPNRIGIYGGSYGGFITLMALFTAPDYFGAGAALRSVTDWAHYNIGYTSNILNLPQNDTLAYRRSSPIYFAEGLRAPLLMAHGMVDANVQYQDIVRLTQRLIELGKEDWELASYPIEDHAFLDPASWTDEYTRIFKLFQRALRKEGE